MELPTPTLETPALMGRIACQLRQNVSELAAVRGLKGQPPGADCYRLLRATVTLEAAALLLRPRQEREVCDLNGAAGALSEALRELCALKPGQLSFFGASEPLPVGLSPSLLTPALCHLACNSLQYGGPGVRLCLKVGRAGGRAYFYLADSGPGLSPQRWFSACQDLSPQDGGLGLFYCRLAASRAGGAFFSWNLPGPDKRPAGCACLLSFPLQQTAPCPAFEPFSPAYDRFSPYLVQLSPCCILPD